MDDKELTSPPSRSTPTRPPPQQSDAGRAPLPQPVLEEKKDVAR